MAGVTSVDPWGGLGGSNGDAGLESARPIENRSGLIHALTEAAELEHGLMLQYLFAALTLKRRVEEGLSVRQAELVRGWAGVILAVAREEMAHLGNVCNLLTAVGGAAHFRRPNFPVPSRYYPTSGSETPEYQVFSLEPFSLETVGRFIAFEAPQRPPPPGERVEPPLRYDTVGGLYKQIRKGIERLAPKQRLFVGPQPAQDTDNWTQAMKMRRIHDVGSALKAIDAIVGEGEATTTEGEGSHWKRFLRIGDQLTAELDKHPEFAPARPVLANPCTRKHFEAPHGSVLDDPFTCRVAELFNGVYEAVVLMLMQYYAFAGELPQQRSALQSTIRRTMSAVMRPLGEILTEMPAGPGYPGQTAGPSFEQYTDLRMPVQATNAWLLLRERLEEAVVECAVLRAEQGAPPRLANVHANLHLVARGIRVAAHAGEE